MVKTKPRLVICCLWLGFNLVFIWGNSLLSAEASAAFSQWVKEMLAFLLPSDDGVLQGGHGLLRKIAHFLEFCSLGLCLGWLFAMVKKHPVAIPLACGVATACIDETIQIFVPGRGPGILDVLIDTLGVCTGLALLYAAYYVYKHKKQHMEETLK